MDFFTRRIGPLPAYVWLLIVIGVAYLYIQYRNKQTAAAQAQANQQGLSSDLGTVPVSNLTTTAMPMPIQLGDTFVNTSAPSSPGTAGVGASGTNPGGTMTPANPSGPGNATQVQTIC